MNAVELKMTPAQWRLAAMLIGLGGAAYLISLWQTRQIADLQAHVEDHEVRLLELRRDVMWCEEHARDKDARLARAEKILRRVRARQHAPSA